MSRLLFLFVLLIVSCKEKDHSLANEIEDFLFVNMPGYQLIPEDYTNPELRNMIPEFEGAISKGIPSNHKHILRFDFNKDGFDDYLIYIFTENLTNTDGDYKYYESKQILIYGSENGFSNDVTTFGSSELGYRNDYYHTITSSPWIIETGSYNLAEPNDTTISITNNTLVMFNDIKAYILEWVGEREYNFTILENQ